MGSEVYTRAAASWWEEDSFLYALRAAWAPALLSYVQEVLLGRFKIEPKGKRLLDLGCGGGWLAEEMRRLGFGVAAVDPSPAAVLASARHAEESGLELEHHVASGEELPYADASFEVVLLCNVLEHAGEIDRVLAETARVLKHGGVLLFSSVAQTPLSRFAMVDVLERWARALPEGFHDARMFVDPGALRGALRGFGIERRELVGLRPAANPWRLWRALSRGRAGSISHAELGESLRLAPSRDASLAYMGHAVRLSAPWDPKL